MKTETILICLSCLCRQDKRCIPMISSVSALPLTADIQSAR